MYKFSIITATYNCAETLIYTINSVIKQKYNNIEYIIVDGSSTDVTKDIINNYSKDISKWISKPDKGVYDAFNKGLQMATGDYVLFLGADDVIDIQWRSTKK